MGHKQAPQARAAFRLVVWFLSIFKNLVGKLKLCIPEVANLKNV
jgi:hypothetical protein